MAVQPQAVVVEVSADDLEAMQAAEDARIAALDGIGASLEGMKDAAVVWRGEFEAEWAQDYAQYNTAARTLAPTKRTGSNPSTTEDAEYRQTADNITRPKVIITASRLGDMLFPTNEANWDLQASPKPDVPDELLPPPPPGPPDEQGNPTQSAGYTPEQKAQAQRDVAAKRALGMRTQIADQLGECKYDEAGRTTIFEGCLYGTGVMFGPALKTYRSHSFSSQGGYNAQMKEAAQPCMEYVDLWSFFPQPSRNINECEHAFRLRVLPKRGVRQLAHQPGFDKAQIARLLMQEPQHGAMLNGLLERGSVRPDTDVVLKDRYTVWQYRGPMPKEGFAAFLAGMQAQGVMDQETVDVLLADLDANPMHEFDCEVWFSQGIVIKMAPSTLAPGELGYYVWNYEENPNSIFGRGVAYLCRDDQHATNQLWRAMMLNSMMSAGPQIGVRKGSLIAQPGGGRDMTFAADKPRVWAMNDDVQDIKQCLSVFIIPNVTDKILGLYERSKANADEHTMTPMIAQGEPTQAVPTSSGMAMLMNAANVVMRRLAKAWDDSITVPAIGAFYDWNMANNPDPEIKGDYCVIPKGSSYLLIKDVQAQHIQFATQLFATNPALAPYMKANVFARKNIEMLDLVPDEMLYTDEEVEERQKQAGQQPDAETIKANAALQTAQAAAKRADSEAQINADKLEWEKTDRAMTHDERMADTAARERIQEMQLKGQQLAIIQRMAEMQSSERIQMQEIIADLQKHGGTLDLGQYVADANARINAEKIASNESNVALEMDHATQQNEADRAHQHELATNQQAHDLRVAKAKPTPKPAAK